MLVELSIVMGCAGELLTCVIFNASSAVTFTIESTSFFAFSIAESFTASVDVVTMCAVVSPASVCCVLFTVCLELSHHAANAIMQAIKVVIIVHLARGFERSFFSSAALW